MSNENKFGTQNILISGVTIVSLFTVMVMMIFNNIQSNDDFNQEQACDQGDCYKVNSNFYVGKTSQGMFSYFCIENNPVEKFFGIDGCKAGLQLYENSNPEFKKQMQMFGENNL